MFKNNNLSQVDIFNEVWNIFDGTHTHTITKKLNKYKVYKDTKTNPKCKQTGLS